MLEIIHREEGDNRSPVLGGIAAFLTQLSTNCETHFVGSDY